MAQTETHAFQAEIRQLLDIVIHSLYTDKEIFVRELVSNASDALEKLRFLQASGKEVLDAGITLGISITTDDTTKTLTFCDTGIGMTKQELVENLGTIARSGSKEFIKSLTDTKEKSLELIGQFGVGFYSAFMVSDQVEVYTRSWKPEEKGWKWTSSGSGEFTVEEAEGLQRGTKIVVHLKQDQSHFSRAHEAEAILKRYSNFVNADIELNGTKVNTIRAIWSRPKNEVTEEEYAEFYKFIGHDSEQPRYRLHFSADAPIAIQSLLYIPKTSIENLGLVRLEPEVNLYCKRVLIQAKAKGLMPDWLRFIKGVVDSEDIPLNISRESMQDSSLIAKLNKVLVGRILKMLDEEAKTNPESYAEFFEAFGHCLKEGAMQDYTHRDGIAPLLRFESSVLEAGKKTSIADYISRMPEGQKEIYFLAAPSRSTAEASAYLEAFKNRRYEVLFLTDPRDEFVMDSLREHDGKKLVSVEKADITTEDSPVAEGALDDKEARKLTNWMKELYGDRVDEVRISKRLVDSPVIALNADPFTTASMRRIMRAVQKNETATPDKAHLEINPSHAVIISLAKARESKPEVATIVAQQLLDSALLAAGIHEDPQTVLKRMNDLMAAALK